jgi:hypothetical protein
MNHLGKTPEPESEPAGEKHINKNLQSNCGDFMKEDKKLLELMAELSKECGVEKEKIIIEKKGSLNSTCNNG